MKLWPALFVICLLQSSVQGVFALPESGTVTDSGLISEAPLNQEYIDYKNTPQSVEGGEDTIFKDQLGYIPEPADTAHLKGKKVSKKVLEAEVLGISDASAGETGEITSAPAAYDLRTTGRVSPVKNQGSCGSCWAFATYGSMESEALPAQHLNFSENNLKNTHGFDYGPCEGGNSQMATAYLSRWSGAVAEAVDPYSDSSTTSSTGLPVQEHAQEILTIPGRSGSLDNDNIKSALQTTGALYTTMYWSASYYNTTSGAYYYSGTSGSNHAVTIVGWDDTYSRTNFMPQAPGDGAFIIKNSWGTSWGNNGYFYLSYYDSRVGKTLTAFTGESATNYNHIYQYDPLGWVSSMGFGSSTAWAANVFTATSQEAVSAVGLTTNQANTSYQMFIYTNPTQGPLNSAGPVTTVQGTIGIPGYHTVILGAPVTVQAGDRFSVVVRFQTPDYTYPVPIETPVSGYSSQASAAAGQSYVSSTGTSWTDLTTRIPGANACLKAFTVNTATSAAAPVASFTGTPTSGTVPLTVAFTDASKNSPTSWSWAFGDGGTSALQNPSHVYTRPGIYQVTLEAYNAIGYNSTRTTGYVNVTKAADRIGVFRNGSWLLDYDGSGGWNAADKNYAFGTTGWTQVTGDWNGDGRTNIGIFQNGLWVLDSHGDGLFSSEANTIFRFGGTGYTPIVGNWNGTNSTRIGVYRDGQWILDYNGDGLFTPGIDRIYGFGGAGYTPVVGDWNGEQHTRIGVYHNGLWILDNNGDGVFTGGADSMFGFGGTGYTPVTGDWNGDGRTKIGIYQNGAWYLDYNGNGVWDTGSDRAYGFGGTGYMPLIGDWNGDGRSKIGVYRDGAWILDYDGDGIFTPGVDKIFGFGGPGFSPLVGEWN